MEAGIVEFKLCNKEYHCETCPFDAVIRIQHVGPRQVQQTAGVHSRNTEVVGERAGSVEEIFEQQLEAFCRPFEDARFPDDRMYTRGFGWVRDEPEAVTRFGILPLALHLLGPVTSIVLPQAPTHLLFHSPCVWVVHREGAAALRAPFPGTITRTNGSLRDQPSLLTDSPFSEGWMLEIAGHDRRAGSLLNSREAAKYFHAEATTIRKYFRTLYKKIRPPVGTTMNDGGYIVSSIQDTVGAPAYFDFVARMLAVT